MGTGKLGRGPLAIVTELSLVVVLALAVGKDVSEAQAKCNTAFKCAADCVNQPDRSGSQELIETTKRFTTGNMTLRCGDYKTYFRVNCQGNPLVLAADCPGTCCR